MQTLLGHLLPSEPLTTRGERHEIHLSDGDKLVGVFFKGTSKHIVYFFHGLAGSSEADYMQRSALVCQKLGHSVFLINHRGCGVGRGLAIKPYHSGRAEDISDVLKYGKNHFPNQRHLVVGFSLSGNALLLLLTGQRGSLKPDGAIAVNAPINLFRAAELLQTGFNRIYDLRFVIKCRNEIKGRRFSSPNQTAIKIPWNANMTDLDSLYTVPEGGFKSREHYYQTCSAKNWLSQITVPTVMLTTQDDPFVSAQDYLDVKLPSAVYLHIEDVGGHMGYITNDPTPLGTRRWLDYALHESLQALTRVS